MGTDWNSGEFATERAVPAHRVPSGASDCEDVRWTMRGRFVDAILQFIKAERVADLLSVPYVSPQWKAL